MSYKPFTTEHTVQVIDDIKKYLEETSKDQTTIDTLDLCHLIGEIERLNNIINELEKYLVERIEYNQGSELQDYLENTYSTIYSVLQELKGDESNGR